MCLCFNYIITVLTEYIVQLAIPFYVTTNAGIILG